MRFCLIRTNVDSSTPSSDTSMQSNANGYGSNFQETPSIPVLMITQIPNHSTCMATNGMLPTKLVMTSEMWSAIVRSCRACSSSLTMALMLACADGGVAD